jgi:signal transduction histidine kinase
LITLEAQHLEALRETVDRLRLEIEELRTSRERLALAADADRRRIERDLHDGVQQYLVALAVTLELARQAGDSSTIKELLAEMRRDVQQALDEAAQLAERVYPPLLDAGGLAAALRSAVVAGSRAASVEVTATASYPPAVAGAVYFCCVEALEHMGSSERAKLTVRDEEGALAFEVVEGDASSMAVTASADGFEQLRDRVEAFGGRLVIRRAPTGGICVSGSIPLSR